MTGGSIDAIYILASKGVEVMYGEGNGGYFYPNHYLTGEQAVVASERLSRVAKKFVQEKAERELAE